MNKLTSCLDCIDYQNANIFISEALTMTSIDNKELNQIDQNQQINQHELEDIYLSKICKLLRLDENNDELRLIAKHLLTDGRQALEQYQASIASSVFEEQMNNNDCSPLLQILKEYFEQQWQQYIPFDWFKNFLAEQKNNNDSSEEYQRVLKRTAEYGSRFTKECPIFSIVLQLIFEFDDETIGDGVFFDVLWKSFAMNGLKLALERSADYIVPEVREQHMNNLTSPLFLALREYFRGPLVFLFQQCKIVDRRNLLDITLDCLANDGWNLGLRNAKVERLIQPKRHCMLIKTLMQYLDEQCLTQYAYSSSCSLSTSTQKSYESESRNDQTLLHTSTMTQISSQLLNVAPQITTSYEPSCSSTQTISELNKSLRIDMVQSCQSMPVIQLSTISLSAEVECDVINECVKHEEKFQLSTFMQAGEFAYIRKRLNDIADEIVKDFSISKNFLKFIQDSLLPIIYLLKRHQNLTDFFEYLFFHYSQNIDSSMDNFAKISMRMIIHVLLLSSNLSVSQMLMTLLSKRNPVPFLEPSLTGHLYSFVSDIIYTWDYSRPTLLSFGIGPCQGKSTLLNTLFMSSFEQTVQSIYFQQTIDIDFGYNFLPRRSVNIADTHGQITKPLLHMVQNFFEGFIIQIEGTFFNNNTVLIQNMLEDLPHDKVSIIIVRDVDEQLRSQYPQFLQIKQHSNLYKIPIIILPNVSDKKNNQNKIHIKLLRDRIFEQAPNRCIHDRDYLYSEIQGLMELDAKFHLKEMINIIEPLKNELIHAVKNVNDVVEYFPVYTKFVELCSQRQKIVKLSFYDSTNEEIYILRQKIYAREKEIEDTAIRQTGRIFDLFINILRSNETMASIHILANDLQYERNQLISKCQMIDQVFIEKNLSLEVLWRNVIVCYPYQQNDVKQLIHNKYTEYITAGYPFEIIDGDNFNFPYDFLHEVLTEFRNTKILVISIIGPQNSGKSTLLNYMFGTLFDARDGRCTRGIYGSFVKSNFSNFDYVLLIDTEGLMGIERGEKEFDRRLVLFCLAVSHVVIINIIGEINDTLKDMLTLCADTLKQIGVSIVPQPKIHFVLNQKADLNIENSRISIEKIRTDIIKLGLDKMVDICKENFHTLPSAFKKERVGNDTRLPSVILTETDFINYVQDLCGTITESGTQPLSRSQEYFCDPLQWLNFANTIFDTLQKFSDLTYFRDINERQQDSKVRSYIKNKLTQIFSFEYKTQLIEETTNYTEDEIRNVLHAKEVKISDDMQQELENELKISKASDTIRDRSRQFLKAQITAMFIAIRSSAVMNMERKKIIRLVQDGEGELKRLIEETIANGTLTTETNAQQIFQSMFNDIITSIQQKFIPFDCLNQTFNFIYTNYNIYEHDCLPDRQVLISEHFQWLKGLNTSQITINDARKYIQTRCTLSAYQQLSYVEEQSFDPDISDSYSLDIINNLVYLNKDILYRQFNDYCNNQLKTNEKNQKQTENKHSNSYISHHLDRFRRVIDLVGNTVGLGKNRTDPNIVTYYFQKQIRQLIKEQKYTITNPNHVIDDNILLQMSNCFQHLTDDIMKEIESRQIDTDLIQRITGSLHTLIKDINLELGPFNLVLSRHVKAVLHSCTILLLTKSYYNEQEIHFQQTLTKLTKGKQEMCNYFVSMVVPNVSYDAISASSLAKQLKNRIYQDLAIEVQQIIKTEVQKISLLNRQWVQERCDGMLTTAENPWLHNYIENPNKVIEDYFASMWKTAHNQINQSLIDQKTHYIETLKDFFLCIKWMLSAIKGEGAAAIFVDSIFQSDTGAILSVNENLKNKKRCMTKILYAYLSGKTIPNQVSAYGATYTLKPEGYDVFDRLAKHSPPSAKLIAITKVMSPIYDSISIGNLTAFLETLLNEKDQIIKFFLQFSSDFNTFDKEDTYKRLLDKVRGCSAKCPCCRRPCDIDHTLIKSIPGSEDNQHCCTLGHALRAMNGYRYEITDEASLIMCEHIKPDQVIVIGPTRKRWSEFKKDHSDWNFDPIMTVDQLNHLHGKFLWVWGKIGPELCEKYGMKFVTTNTLRPVEHFSLHYILLLDGSGSMTGQPWKDLLDGIKEFLKCRLSRNSVDRISIIVFSSIAKIVYFNETISNIDLSTITFPSGNTNFANAFATVHSVITRAKEQTSNIASNNISNTQIDYEIVFMSDGQATYPKKEVTNLAVDYKMLIKRFWTVALGQRQMDSLEKINETMNGFFLNIKDSCDLLETYAEIARTN
jgi:uncharacterized protein YegL/GTPase SAR1 family protein